MFPDKLERAPEQRIVNGEQIRGLTGHHSFGRDAHDLPVWPPPAIGRDRIQQAIQRERDFGAVARPRQRDAAQGRIRQIAHQLIVIHHHDGDLLGHGDAGVPADLGQMPAERIVGSEDPDRFGQLVQPADETVVDVVQELQICPA